MPNDNFDKSTQERDKHTNIVLNSKSRKKVVVAGPGTGKTFLFSKVLEGKDDSVTLTFINALVDDLSLGLFGLSQVKTLHGFARSVLGDKVEIFPKLPEVITLDGKIILGTEIDFDELLSNCKDNDQYVTFYKERRKYYGKYYGFTDIIYALTKYFEIHPEKIPTFSQIVVDEFQDFNLLEVSLVDQLATKSPILVAGDDDQALYDFKHASPEYIRNKHGIGEPDYEPFNLPYCSRCPRVVVTAVSNIIENAGKGKLLNGRISKTFNYFESKEKNVISDKYPKIDHAVKYDSQIPWYIENEIAKIARDLRKEFTVLVISPLKKQSIKYGKKFIGKGFEKVEYPNDRSDGLSMLDGLGLLMDDKECNLGWRIVAQFSLDTDEFNELICKSQKDNTILFKDMLGKDVISNVMCGMGILKKIKDGTDVTEDNLKELVSLLKYDTASLIKESLQMNIFSSGDKGNKKCYPGIRKIPIKTTTIQGSKGLAADYVFITHFDDKYILDNKNDICDRDVYKLLVAITRAKSKVYLISTSKDRAKIQDLINQDNISEV